MENPIKMEDLGVPLFLETPKCFRSFMEKPSNGQQAAPQREVSPRPVDFGNHASPHRQFEISSLKLSETPENRPLEKEISIGNHHF